MAHNQKLILELLKIEENDECADCGRKGKVYRNKKKYIYFRGNCVSFIFVIKTQYKIFMDLIGTNFSSGYTK